MAPLGVSKAAAAPAESSAAARQTQTVPAYVKLFNDVRTRLEVEKQVTFEESGRAFVQAQERLADPETRRFVEDVMVGAVEIFLNQTASNVQPPLLIHFEEVLRAAGKIISWELRTLRCIKHLDLLGKVLDESMPFYLDKRTLIANSRRCSSVRLLIVNELVQDGTFEVLLQMLRGHIPILEWSPLDFAPLAGKPQPESAPLTARIMYLIMVPALNARHKDVNLLAFGEACMKEMQRSFTGENLKRQKAEDITELHMVLLQIYGPRDEALHEFSLNLWLRCFESDAFAIKKLGLEHLIRVCNEAVVNRHPSQRSVATPSGMSSPTPMSSVPERFPTPLSSWDDIRICRWLNEKRVLDSLFGSGAQTHSALVGRSKSFLDSMAKAGVLNAGHIDMIFESGVGKHESSRGAVHSLLAELLLDLTASGQIITGPESPPILVLRKATNLIEKRPEEMYYFGRKVMQLESTARNRGIMTSRNVEIQKAMLEFLWTLAMRMDLSSDEKEADSRAEQALSDFNDALRTAVVPLPTSYTFTKSSEIMNEDRIFSEFLRRCESILTLGEEANGGTNNKLANHDTIVWRACAVLKHLVQLHSDVVPSQSDQSWMSMERSRPEWSKQSQVEFVEDLEARLHLTEWLVERIKATPKEVTDRTAKARLDFLRFFAERIRAHDSLDIEKIKACWSAFGNREELRLSWLRELVTRDSTKVPVLSPIVTEHVFNELLCTADMETLGTQCGFDCFASYFYEINRPRHRLHGSPKPEGNQVPILGLETLWNLVINGTPLVEDKAAHMLLAIQRRAEAGNPDSGIPFVERIMTALERASSDVQKKRCIQLAAAYMEYQVILEPHMSVAGRKFGLTSRVTVHHDDLITFGHEDVGKVMEKRFREKNGTFGWYAGLISEYNSYSGQHVVCFRDGDLKNYDFKNLLRENSQAHLDSAAQSAERPLFRMLSIVSDGFKFDSKPIGTAPSEALQRYKGLTLILSPNMTIANLKSQVLDYLGRRLPSLEEADTEFQVEVEAPLPVVPEYLRLRTNIPASAGGKALPYVRYRIVNESLPAHLIATRFNGKLFLCAKIAESLSSDADIPVTHARSSAPAMYLVRENSPQHALLQALVQDISLPEEIRVGAWSLIMTLPTEMGILQRVTAEGFDWDKELNAFASESTVLRQVYLLQIADKLCIDAAIDDLAPTHDDTFERFRRSFFRPDIANRVITLFTRIMSPNFTSEWERGVALRVVVRLIQRFIEHRLILDAQQLSRDLTHLILWDMAIQRHSPVKDIVTNGVISVDRVTPPPPPPLPVPPSTTAGLEDTAEAPDASLPDEADLSLIAIDMAMSLVDDPANRKVLLEGDEGDDRSLIDVLLLSPFAGLRGRVYRLLLRIAETEEDAVFSRVVKALMGMQDYTLTCGNFFDFIREFVVLGSSEKVQKRCRALMDVVRLRLNEYKYSGANEDPTLNGMLDLCRILVENGACNQMDDTVLVETIVTRFLLAVESANVASSIPSRLRCFALLRAIVSHNTESFLLLVGLLGDFVKQVSKPLARGGRFWDLNFRTEDTRRPSGTRVGLVNQGATCYQNSVLQQLFMRTEMRQLLLRAIPGLEASGSVLSPSLEEEESSAVDGEPLTKKKAKGKHELLVQLHGLFSFLNCSEQRYFNPRSFVNHSAMLRLTDGHMSQNDCIEFYSLLMEYLEEVFKGRVEREQLRNLFVCSMTSLTIRHCPKKHRSEKEESTFYISLSIRYGPEGRALNSLEEALDEWSKSEHLSDLICEECFPPRSDISRQNSSSQAGGGAGGGAMVEQQPTKQRFDADQVKFITRFPPILVLQLKRFDFDYDTLLPTKLNHRVSFEQRLDLGRFTREAVLRQFEGGPDNQEEPHVWYRLKGVVVHQGTGANFGHYYSFIEDDEQKAWFRFDDERVTPFDLANLEEECFGGPVVLDAKSASPAYAAAAAAGNKRQGFGGLRNNNGYLLIYTKETIDSKPQELPESALRLLHTPSTKPISLRTLGCIGRLVCGWRSRARIYLESRRIMSEHGINVTKENECVLRHAIAFAPDFLVFCLKTLSAPPLTMPKDEEGIKETGFLLASLLFRVVIFSATEKERYDLWASCLKSTLQQSPLAESAVCDWILTEVNADRTWLDRLLLHCLDVRSSSLFTEILLHAINKARPELVESLAENIIRMFPKTAVEATRYPQAEGNFFVVFRELSLLSSSVREFFLRRDGVYSIVKLLDESVQSTADADHPISQRQARSSDMGGFSPVARDEKLCTKVVAALDALLFGHTDECDDDTASGFPLLTKDSASAIFSDSFLMILIQVCPRPAKRLIARLCDCSPMRYERCFERLTQSLVTSQWPAKAIDAPYIIPDVCEILEYLFMATELDVNAAILRERNLTQLVKLAKDTKRIAAERKEQQATRSLTTFYSNSSYGETERQDAHRASVLLITHVGEMLTSLALNSDSCRSVLRKLSWSWLVQTLDVNSFDSCIGGNETSLVRDLPRGQAVRQSQQAAIALGQLPRPIVTPAIHTIILVEDAGLIQSNGWYRFDGFFSPGVSETVDSATPKFAHVDKSSGRRFTIFRCAINESFFWYLSELSDKPGTAGDIDYYRCKDTGSGLPDSKWVLQSNGVEPAPRVIVRRAVIPNPEDDPLEFANV